jgi:hypothetical protein
MASLLQLQRKPLGEGSYAATQRVGGAEEYDRLRVAGLRIADCGHGILSFKSDELREIFTVNNHGFAVGVGFQANLFIFMSVVPW